MAMIFAGNVGNSGVCAIVIVVVVSIGEFNGDGEQNVFESPPLSLGDVSSGIGLKTPLGEEG